MNDSGDRVALKSSARFSYLFTSNQAYSNETVCMKVKKKYVV